MPAAAGLSPRHGAPSLAGSHRSVAVPEKQAGWRRYLAFFGPGYLVAVGYMDPGNWATDIAGGSAYGYALLSVVLLSSVMAIVLQALCVRLGIAADLDLAQACRAHYSPPVVMGLWILAELAIIACDLAEVLGTAIALQLMFRLPLIWGVLITALDVFLILGLQRLGFRKIEAFIIALLAIIAGCFWFELLHAGVDGSAALAGLVPTTAIITDPGRLYVAIGILGATVMPHNLYLHSSIVQTRAFARDEGGRREAARLASWDSSIALTLAFFINAAILVLAAAVFHAKGHTHIAEIDEAYRLLSPLMGVAGASLLFGLALLASGMNSTVTGTLAGQIVMEGFLKLRLPVWARRLVTRLLAIVPAALAVGWFGGGGATRLLLLSQVVLSLQLPFAVVPLIRFNSDPRVMKALVAPIWLQGIAWVIGAVIILLNSFLIVNFIASSR